MVSTDTVSHTFPSSYTDACDSKVGRLSHLDSHFPSSSNLCHCAVSPSLSWSAHGPTGRWLLVLFGQSLSSRVDL
jgi:hypothetical protein